MQLLPFTEKRNLELDTGDLPDVFMKCAISTSELQRHGAEGSLIPLNSLIGKHTVNNK